ncbi:DNA-binding protein [Priestia aryabhattai]|nr:DNA-binding protein [Priestia aryabhattai]
MIEFSLNEEGLRELYRKEVQKHLKKIEMETMLMDSKQLCKMLNLSWPTIEKLFLNDSNFPKIRIGKKWIFNRREVQIYIDRWSIETQQQGGMINI